MENDFHQGMRRIEGLIQTIEAAADPKLRANALELVRSLMALHGAGLERMMETIRSTGEAGQSVFEQLGRDELIASLLLLYGLHPVDLETRVRQALDQVRPYLRSHGGNVELLAIDNGVVHLRLEGSCSGCPSSSMTLKLAVERAIYDKAPDAAGIEVERERQPAGSERPAGAANGNGASDRAAQTGSWETVSAVESLAAGSARILEVNGRPVLFCRLGKTLYAYNTLCAACGQTLTGNQLESGTIVCRGCGERYEVARAGRGVDRPELYLQPFPLLEDRGQVKVALPAC